MIPLLLSSCWQEEADNIQVLPNRTVLFYMAGDNSLGGGDPGEDRRPCRRLGYRW